MSDAQSQGQGEVGGRRKDEEEEEERKRQQKQDDLPEDMPEELPPRGSKNEHDLQETATTAATEEGEETNDEPPGTSRGEQRPTGKRQTRRIRSMSQGAQTTSSKIMVLPKPPDSPPPDRSHRPDRSQSRRPVTPRPETQGSEDQRQDIQGRLGLPRAWEDQEGPCGQTASLPAAQVEEARRQMVECVGTDLKHRTFRFKGRTYRLASRVQIGHFLPTPPGTQPAHHPHGQQRPDPRLPDAIQSQAVEALEEEQERGAAGGTASAPPQRRRAFSSPSSFVFQHTAHPWKEVEDDDDDDHDYHAAGPHQWPRPPQGRARGGSRPVLPSYRHPLSYAAATGMVEPRGASVTAADPRQGDQGSAPSSSETSLDTSTCSAAKVCEAATQEQEMERRKQQEQEQEKEEQEKEEEQEQEKEEEEPEEEQEKEQENEVEDQEQEPDGDPLSDWDSDDDGEEEDEDEDSDTLNNVTSLPSSEEDADPGGLGPLAVLVAADGEPLPPTPPRHVGNSRRFQSKREARKPPLPPNAREKAADTAAADEDGGGDEAGITASQARWRRYRRRLRENKDISAWWTKRPPGPPPPPPPSPPPPSGQGAMSV